MPIVGCYSCPTRAWVPFFRMLLCLPHGTLHRRSVSSGSSGAPAPTRSPPPVKKSIVGPPRPFVMCHTQG